MNGQELATAVQYGANVVFIVVNNGMYGTIRMHQETRVSRPRQRHRRSANPDFAALRARLRRARRMVEDTAQFAPAFERALRRRQARR